VAAFVVLAGAARQGCVAGALGGGEEGGAAGVANAPSPAQLALIDEADFEDMLLTAEIASRIADEAFDWLDAPVKRYAAMDVPVPFNPTLEDQTLPTLEGLVARVRQLLEGVF
jgi:pyruvate dehydrogenase E1 component beta subunit